jgi:hypothetical protein
MVCFIGPVTRKEWMVVNATARVYIHICTEAMAWSSPDCKRDLRICRDMMHRDEYGQGASKTWYLYIL